LSKRKGQLDKSPTHFEGKSKGLGSAKIIKGERQEPREHANESAEDATRIEQEKIWMENRHGGTMPRGMIVPPLEMSFF